MKLPLVSGTDEIDEISKRIDELGNKSTQVLLFLSFAMVSVAALETVSGAQIRALNNALWWWKCALLPILISILPMKEFWWKSLRWYQVIRWIRVVLVWLAVLLIILGVAAFFKA